MFEAVPHVLSYLTEPGSYAHLSLRVRLGRLCHQAQAVWRGDGCRAERDEVERQEDELQAQLDREAEEDAAHSDFTSNVRHSTRHDHLRKADLVAPRFCHLKR